MPWIEDEGTDGSSFVWTIQNFSYCWQKPEECLDSPSFVLDSNETDKWHLRIYPRGEEKNDFSDFKSIALFLVTNSTSSRTVEFALSIQTAKGSFIKLKDLTSDISDNVGKGHPRFLTSEELREKRADTYLDNDTMTLRCRIWKVDGKIVPRGQCYARTIIQVKRTTNIWSLGRLPQNMSSDEITAEQPISSENQSLVAMDFVFCRENSFSADKIKLEVKQSDKNKPCFVTCDLSLMEAGGKVVHSVQREHRFDASEVLKIWTLPCISLSKILDYGKMNLRCELAVSSGIQYSWVERVESSKIDNHQPTRFNLKKEQEFSDSLQSDLQRYYSDGMLTDFIIRTPSKEFPVHKAILCARSTVFHTIFEQDMKENRTGVVDIEDIDADTVLKMLLFAYSDDVEDLDCDVASKLYIAADKYRITALKRRCSDFLKENLGVSNVCEVTVIANMHQDEELKAFAQDFIVEHAAEVMLSGEWTRFKQDYVHLYYNTVDLLLLRNLNISK